MRRDSHHANPSMRFIIASKHYLPNLVPRTPQRAKPPTLRTFCCSSSYDASSLNNSLSSCLLPNKPSPSTSSLSKARKLHALLIINGFFNSITPQSSSSSLLSSKLVHIYVELGHFQEAHLVFHHLPRTTTLACNAILRAYIQSSQFFQAIQFFFQHMVFDNYTCPLVLKACSALSLLEEGKRVHELIRFNEIHNEFRPNVYTKCALIDMFVKCGSLDEARKVFDEMPERDRDLASWTAILHGMMNLGDCDWLQVLSMFKQMVREGTRPDSMIIASIIPSCGRVRDIRTGLSLHGLAVRSGVHSDLFVSNALIDMYCKFGQTVEAYGIFHSMFSRDSVSWSAIISGFSQNREYGKSLEVFLAMKKSDVEINAVMAVSIVHVLGKLELLKQGNEMHCLIIKRGFDFDVVVASALIDMYTSCGSMREAEIVFGVMSNCDIMIWNSLIGGYASNGNSSSGFDTFRDISKSGFKPNSITLMTILPLCTEVGELKHGKEVHCYSIKSNLVNLVSISNSIMDMYCKCGCLELGMRVFEHMKEKNVISYNTLISAYGMHGHGRKALALFNEMKSVAIQPSKITFVGLLSACSHAGLIEEGWSLYTSMVNEYKMKPNSEQYSCMVDLFGRAGRVTDACKFIRLVPEDVNFDVFGSLLAACRVHNMVELAEVLADRFVHKFDDPGYNVLLSNINASMEKWDDASRFRALIKEKGLVKKPGQSWIQIGHYTHVFDARDTSHAEFNRIERVLKTLRSEMMRESFISDSWLSYSTTCPSQGSVFG